MSVSDEYKRYLVSAQWQVTRARAIIRAGGRCERCAATQQLEAHHLTYERLGREKPEDLEILCRKCHRRYHGLPVARADMNQLALFDAPA